MKLWEYTNKRLKITDVNGKIHTGIGDHYTSELDSPEGVATLSLDPDGRDDIYIEFEESEILKIEILPAEVPILAEAI
ncbi:MAG: hypothetical protein FWB80_04570 [Defluviitaleaceae bacterium]|nr:hypothetical protein [Defluviitaleaceae bacterium]